MRTFSLGHASVLVGADVKCYTGHVGKEGKGGNSFAVCRRKRQTQKKSVSFR